MNLPLFQTQSRSSGKSRWTWQRRERIYWFFVGSLMWLLAIMFVLPFLWMIIASLKREIDVFSVPIQWLPNPLELTNYVVVWTGAHALTRYLGNSLLVAGARVLGELLTSSLAAYGFARLSFRGRNTLFLLYISTLIIPFQLLLVPRFILFQQLGIYDTLWALILPGIFTAFGTFLLRQFFLAIPEEFSDAARLDGASEWTIYWRLILPLAKPALATLAILAFVSSWNDYETPLVMLTTESHFTIPLGLTSYVDESGGFSAALTMAGAVSATLPIFAVVLVMQRQFIQALSSTGLKG
ncbi:carbohydrate ABC transporter permease [Dictyobacter aurantiacus]|uniref:ABC transporter permease n=1 Tax=Dictyobacter aurantiacus TaxID=1936993 RepID=A0A401ZRF3_9CHLR|nr:carbohydrate ABC transporter permease [Dictyobacter aurantiacus]GCE09402.1 ABC transporter permease [Dictyobacter aurantiacus]